MSLFILFLYFFAEVTEYKNVIMTEKEEKQEANSRAPRHNSGQAWWQPAMIMFLRFSSWIFAPILIAVFVGKWLDKKYDTEPILFLVTVGFAFLISIFGLVKNVKKEYGKIEKEIQEKKKDNEK